MQWLESPQRMAALALLEEHVPRLATTRRTVVLIGRCRMEYEGHAKSSASWGDRVVLLKPDGSLLLHDPSGFKPVNWMPPGGAFRVGATEYLWIEAARQPPPGTLRIEIDRIDVAGAILMEHGLPPKVSGREVDLRDALRKRPELVETGFVPWARERMTERGPMDLYGEDARGRRVVIECKVIPAGLAEATQLWRYVEKERAKRTVEVRGILVAPRVAQRARELLADHGLEWREVSLVESAKTPLPSQPSLVQWTQP